MRRIFSPQLLLLGLFLLAGLIAFSPNLNSYFLSDDFVQIGKVLHGDTSVVWGQEHGGFFRPIFIWSYFLDSHIWHARSFGYHVTNVIVHALNAFLVFNLIARMLRALKVEPRNINIVAISAAALFLLHPSHSEAVIWISGRADLLATFFMLASLIAYTAYATNHRRLCLLVSIGLLVIALLAKESAICTPILVLIIGLLLRVKLSRLVSSVTAFAFIVLLFVVARARFIGSFIGGYGTAQHLNFAPGWIRDRLLEALVRAVSPALPDAWRGYLFKPLQSPVFYLLVLFILAATTASILIRRRRYEPLERKNQNRLLFAFLTIFLASLLPVINLRLSIYQTQGERFLYLPTVSACFLIAYLAAILIRNEKAFAVFIGMVIAFYSWGLYRTNLLWREAANLSSNLSQQLATSASQPSVAVLNAPDNLRGVPVFHNGLPEAVMWFHSSQIEQIQIAAFQELESASSTVEITGSETLTLRAHDYGERFIRVGSTECFDALSPAPDNLQIRRKPCGTAPETFLFSAGKIRELSGK
jgi:hypothetical protein